MIVHNADVLIREDVRLPCCTSWIKLIFQVSVDEFIDVVLGELCIPHEGLRRTAAHISRYSTIHSSFDSH
jgi:hypothetical protein